MRTSHWLLCTALIPFGIACTARPQESAQPIYTTTATIKELMDSVVDPSADIVWNAATTVVDKRGINDRAPSSDAEWAQVRRGAITLVEASNLLLVPGRHVAAPGDKSVTPGVELEPGEMEALIAKDRATWSTHARALHDVSLTVLHAIDARDADRLVAAGGDLDAACESCHKQYWYPNEKIPQFPADLQSATH